MRSAHAVTMDQDVVNPGCTGNVRNIVQVTPWISVLVVDGWRNNSVFDGEAGSHNLHGARSPKSVATHRLDRGDGDTVSLLAKCQFDPGCLGDVVVDHRVSVGTYVVDVFGAQPSISDSHGHCSSSSIAFFVNRSELSPFRGTAEAENPGINRDSAGTCVGVVL